MRDVYVRLWAVMIVITLSGGMLTVREAWGQAPAPPVTSPSPSTPLPQDLLLLTIFLRPDQSTPLRDRNTHLRQTGYYTKFPPPGIEVVSWYVLVGLGHV
jgi:hypothetical protein